ncbi:MAG: alpha-2-macroglobulin family protein [Polyangiaceae bacterium]
MQPTELSVAFAAPRGEVTTDAEITLVFNKPVHALAIETAIPAITVNPAVAGEWRWVGSRALQFVHSGPLPAATHFEVTVPAGLTSFDGSALAEPLSWSFDTTRPALEAAWYGPLDRTPSDLELLHPSEPLFATGLPSDPIRLTFNQSVDARAIGEVLRVTTKVKDKERALATAVEAVPDAPNDVVVRVKDVPADADLLLTLAEVRSAEGPLVGRGLSLPLRSRGPLRVVGLFCTTSMKDGERKVEKVDPKKARCVRGDEMELRLTEPIVDGDLDVAISSSGHPIISTSASRAPDGTVAVGLWPDYEDTSLRFTIATTLSDDRGLKLDKPFKAEITFFEPEPEPDPPYVEFAMTGVYGTLPRDVAIPISMFKAHGVSVYAVALDSDAAVKRALDPKAAPPAPSGPIEVLPDPKPDQETRVSIDLKKLLGRDVPRHATLVFVARYTPDGASKEEVIVREARLTDTAVIARTSLGHALAWVLDASTGAPVADATVRVHGDAGKLVEGRTDSRGRADLKIPVSGKSIVLGVERGDDFVLTPLTQDGGRPSPSASIVFTDRGIYRPGETVYLKGIVRSVVEGRLVPSAAKSGKLSFYNVEKGREVEAKIPVTLGDYGTFSVEYVVPPDAALGWRVLEFQLDGETTIQSSRGFVVAEYHPIEIEVSARLGAASQVRGDVARCDVEGHYLFGSPLAGGNAAVRWSAYPTSFRPEVGREFDGYEFGAPYNSVTWGTSASLVLGALGAVSTTAKLDLPAMTNAATVTCSANVMDFDRRELETSADEIVHPGLYYIGLDAPHRVELGEKFDVDVIAAKPEGALTTADVEVAASLVERGAAPVELGKCSVHPDAGPARCSFTSPKDKKNLNREIELRATSTDTRNNPITTLRRLDIVQPTEPVPVTPSVYTPRAPELTLAVTHGPHQVGDVVTLTITSAWKEPAQALLSIQRETVIEERLLTLDARGATLDLKLTDAMAPYVNVQLYAVAGSEKRSAGSSIEVSPESTALKVALNTSTNVAAPGSDLDLDVVVTEPSGAPAADTEVTLWGADVGSLDLAFYRRPDPLWLFDDLGRAYVDDVLTYDSPLRILPLGSHRSKPPSVRMGATSASWSVPRSDFRQSVLFEPSLVTDASGHVRHRVKLPDQLTEFRFFAVAVSKSDRFGATQTEIVTKKTVMVRPSMPAVVRAGDTFSVIATVQSTDADTRPITVSIATEGVEVVGDRRGSVSLVGGAPTNVTFRVRADKAATYQIRIDAERPDGQSDHVLLSGDVVVPVFFEESAVSGQADSPVAEAFGDLSDARDDIGQVTVRISRSRLIGLERGIEQLLQYPFGCAEQTASRMLPHVVLGDLAQALGVTLGADSKAALAQATSRLAGYQNLDGGFGLWASSATSDPWLTAYIVGVLDAAKQRGFDVPDPLLPRASKFIEGFVHTKTSSKDEPTPEERVALALAIDDLAAEGKDIDAASSWLAGRLTPDANIETALLLHALAVKGGHEQAREALRSELEKRASLDGPIARVAGPSAAPAFIAGTVVVSSALALRALLADSPKHPLIEPLARGLIDAGRGGAWRTTHETSWSLVALDAYRVSRAEIGATSARVFLGDELVLDHVFEPGGPLEAKVDLPIKRVLHGERLTFDPKGGTLFYDVRLHYARRTLPTEPVDRGLSVERTLTVMSVNRAAGTIVSGDMVRVDVRVVSAHEESAAVVEIPLAGGLYVPDDQRLSSAAGDVPRPFTRREVRDDRVLYFADRLPAGVARITLFVRARHEGSYVMPSAKAELMYAPEVAGFTEAQKLTILSSLP